MRPDPTGVGGVGLGKFDGVHLGSRGRPGDAQRPVTAVGAKFERQLRVGPPDGGVEQRALLVADIDQYRLLVGEPVDRRDDIVDVAGPSVGQHVLDGGGFPAVADLARGGDVAAPVAIRQTDHRSRGMRCFRLMIATLARWAIQLGRRQIRW